MKIGVDYYPEQWDRALWSKDAELMAKTGVKTVRLAEFAWSRLEPTEGSFDFSWLDEVISVFSHFGLEIILCTPTNCPPLWLYESHPEIIQTGPDGKRIQTGIRGHRCINSPVFLEYAKRITDEMARHYASHPSVKAWQIDNELEAYPCCCEECTEGFRDWLIDRFDTVENINKVFGNSVWSGEYSSITQIQPPTAYPKAWQNPALCMEYYRFCCDSLVKYVKTFSAIIRRHCPKARITTNTWLCENMPDFYKLFDELDFVSYDNYPPVRIPENPDCFYSHAFHLDMMRGIKEQNFWVMEQLSGSTGSWAPMAPAPKPGMIKGYSLQAIAHGADAVVHFRWRTALTGAEMHWHGILDHSNVPNRRFFEFAELCKTVSKLDVMKNTQIVSDIAILYSPESEYALKAQPQTEGFYYFEQLKYFHSAFTRYGANVDIVSPGTDLSDYRIVVAPSLYVNNKSDVENIYRFVMNGGTLVLTTRSGVKDKHNNCIMDTLPTVFKELIGAEVTEYDPIGGSEQTIVDFAGNQFRCRQWCDIIKPTTARTYAEYADSFYRCCPAITLNEYCKGAAYYIGTVCKMDFYEDFARKLMKQTGIPRLKGLPRGVEVTTRTNGVDDYIFFFNNSEQNATIGLPKPMYSILDSVGKDRIELKPFEMEVVRK